MRLNRTALLEDRGQGSLGFSVSEMTRVPPSDWRPPDLSSLPDRLYGDVGVDLETEDRGLRDKQGPGWAWRGGGKVVGYSLAADNWSGYLPVAHEGGDNVADPDQARRWLNHALGRDDQLKVFANAMYDVGWAGCDGVAIRGPVRDVQLVEPLLDENRLSYSLEEIANDRIGERKDETLLTEAARAHGFGSTRDEVKRNLWKLPARFVGPYAEWDAAAPLKIFRAQLTQVAAEGLEKVVDLEHRLLPLYMMMRRRGVRVDVPYAERLKVDLEGRVEALRAEIKRRCGQEVEIWAPNSIAKALAAEGVHCGRTDKTNQPSVTQGFLERVDHWLTRLILEARQLDKLRGTFVEGQVLGALHDGRVHGSIHPLKSDEGGTGTGRLSMGNPNLQFIPARTDEGKKIRGAFIAEDGEELASSDFNQQEVRLLVHYACLAAGWTDLPRDLRDQLATAFEARDRYRSDPRLNYHNFVADLTELEYKPAKILNFAIIYGRGVHETAVELELSDAEARELFDRHAERMPFARAMSKACQRVVRKRGYITSLGGRRVRFPLWEPSDWDARDGRMLPLEKAREAWPGQELVRARIHKALNSLVQPAAAGQMKYGMLAVYEAGLGHHVRIQVHDELVSSVPDRRVAVQIADAMRDAVPLEVPSVVDVECGPNWMEQS